MPSEHDSIGRCPRCGASIPLARMLIEYERTGGEIGVFAECPACEAVVDPE